MVDKLLNMSCESTMVSLVCHPPHSADNMDTLGSKLGVGGGATQLELAGLADDAHATT